MSDHTPLIYSNPWVYRAFMRMLYGAHFESRYETLAGLIPDGVSVIDVCAGDCRLYTHHLIRKGVNYRALDLSPQFIARAKQAGINADLFDVNTGEIPKADYIVMQASLYQFLPHADRALAKLFAASQKCVLVAEPIRNLSDSDIPVLSGLSRWMTKPPSDKAGQKGDRFSEDTFCALAESYPQLDRILPIPGGRELIAVFCMSKTA